MILTSDCRTITPSLLGGTRMLHLATGGTGTFYSDAIDVGTFKEILAFCTVESHSGSPTLDVTIQHSPDNSGNWVDGDAFTQVTTGDTTTLKRVTAIFGRWIRVKFIVGGTTPTYKWSLALVCKS